MRDLVLGLAAHAALGVALSAVVWGVGLGLLAGRGFDPVDAYPVGLLAVVAAAVALLLDPWLGLVGLAVLLAAAAGLVRHREAVAGVLRHGLAPLVWASPAVLGLPVLLGLL